MASNAFSPVSPPVFTGETAHYHTWAVRMSAYLQAVDLWEAVEEDYEIDPLPDNPTVQQIKVHKERRTKKFKAKSCLHSAVSEALFTKIMNLKSAFEIWQYLREEFQGNARTRSTQVLNLIREFELQKMKESETVKEYVDRLLSIVNRVKLLGEQFSDRKIVEKILGTLLEKLEAKISALEESRDLAEISLAELLNALQAQEQRRQIREEGSIEGALQAKLQIYKSGKDKKTKWRKHKGAGANSSNGNAGAQNNNGNAGRFPSCPHCGMTNHSQNRCWSRPDVKCNRCNQMGHVERICKSRSNQ
ncbi:uncharacterized protein LOC116105100 [Pistacia vera]|uniref:uncharacterized protein LOC116105100 n=1 Tax=Pistacia vera TaxID=55513 RepID=UPI001263CC19|nr:uncharacterized protein LOC116105100 [Pistacia vera]